MLRGTGLGRSAFPTALFAPLTAMTSLPMLAAIPRVVVATISDAVQPHVLAPVLAGVPVVSLLLSIRLFFLSTLLLSLEVPFLPQPSKYPTLGQDRSLLTECRLPPLGWASLVVILGRCTHQQPNILLDRRGCLLAHCP